MAFPGPGYKSPKKKEYLKTDKTIVGEYCTKEQEKLLKGLAEAIYIYCKGKKSKIIIDDVLMEVNPSKGEWHKMSLYFKVIK